MVKIANNSNSLAASLGGSIGGGISNALVKALNGIAQNKVSDIESRQAPFQQRDSTLEALKLIGEPQQSQGPNPQGIDLLREMQKQPGFEEALKSINPQQNTEQGQPTPQFATGNETGKKVDTIQRPSSKKEVKSFPKDSSKLSTKQIDKILDSAGPKTPKPVKKAEIIAEENPDPIKHAKVVDKQNKEIKKLPQLSEKQQLAADKETKSYFDDISKAAKGAKEGSIRLDRMIELIREGRLNWPSAASFIDTLDRGIPLFGSHIGIDVHFLENQPTHEFRKLSSDFVKGAKDVFGGRVTNLDLESFMKTIPGVTQSDQGKIAVIRNMRLLNAGALVRKKAMDDIISENDGHRPPNLESLVEERSSDQLDTIAERFRKGIYEKDEAEANLTAQNRKILGIF